MAELPVIVRVLLAPVRLGIWLNIQVRRVLFGEEEARG